MHSIICGGNLRGLYCQEIEFDEIELPKPKYCKIIYIVTSKPLNMDIISFCHLRWNFVYQRPQNFLPRFTRQFRVFVIEEPRFDSDTAFLETELNKDKVPLVIPHLPPGMADDEVILTQQSLLRKMFTDFEVAEYIAWYYTPMALDISEGLPCPSLVIYDCMDELSAFKNAPPTLSQKETL